MESWDLELRQPCGWLGICTRRYVALKVYTRGQHHDKEFELYQTIGKTSPSHPGHRHVRTALEAFTIEHNNADHRCLVQKPMWDSFGDLLQRNPTHRFSEDLLKAGLQQVFLALDFLHSECKLVHTDIKGDNILQEIEDNSILEDFVQDELEHPAPRNFVAGKTIYATRLFNLPKEFGAAVLSDFGSAERGDEVRHRNAQPEVYRSPEVMLKADWSYPVDIWNVGVLIWDLFEDKHMFYGEDPDGKGYSTRAHLADIISLLGPPPHDLLERGRRVKEFFDEKGQFIADVPVPKNSLEQSDENLEGDNKKAFLEFMRCMLQWRPEDRKTAKELLEHPWLKS